MIANKFSFFSWCIPKGTMGHFSLFVVGIVLLGKVNRLVNTEARCSLAIDDLVENFREIEHHSISNARFEREFHY